jgi:hypothetical protein
VVELRRGTKGTVNRWLAHHVAEVGGGSARRDGARGEAAALSQLKEEEGCRPPPPPPWVSQLGRKGHAGRLADSAKSQERILSNLNRLFRICQGFGNLHKEIYEEF